MQRVCVNASGGNAAKTVLIADIKLLMEHSLCILVLLPSGTIILNWQRKQEASKQAIHAP